MTVKDITGLALGVGAAGLALGAVKDLNKSLKGKSSSKNLVKGATKLIVGTALLGAGAEIVNKL